MDADTNFFKVFGLPLCWQIDLKVLKEKHRSLQKDFHPDLFVNSSEVEKQRSVEKASVINEGFRVLCSPLSRAQHLLELHGCNANDENAISSDTSFLMKQLEYRELLAKIPESENPSSNGLIRIELFYSDFISCKVCNRGIFVGIFSLYKSKLLFTIITRSPYIFMSIITINSKLSAWEYLSN